MLSGGFGDVSQSLPAFSALSSPSTAVSYTALSSASTPTPVILQVPSTRRVPATTGRQSQPTSNSLSASDAPHFGGVPASASIQLDSHVTAKAATTTDDGHDRFQANLSVRRSGACGANGSSTHAEMVIDEKDVVSSRRGRLAQPSVNSTTSTEVASSFPAGQIDTTTTSFVHQRPSSSNQHVRSVSHRSARAAEIVPATSTSTPETVPDAAVTDGAPEPPTSPSFLQTSNVASVRQDGAAVDVGKSVCQCVKFIRKLAWVRVTVCGQTNISVCNRPARSTQPSTLRGMVK